MFLVLFVMLFVFLLCVVGVDWGFCKLFVGEISMFGLVVMYDIVFFGL